MDDYESCVVAMDKGTVYIRAVFFCSKADAWKYEKVCQALGYDVRAVTHRELKDMVARENQLRKRYMTF